MNETAACFILETGQIDWKSASWGMLFFWEVAFQEIQLFNNPSQEGKSHFKEEFAKKIDEQIRQYGCATQKSFIFKRLSRKGKKYI